MKLSCAGSFGGIKLLTTVKEYFNLVEHQVSQHFLDITVL